MRGKQGINASQPVYEYMRNLILTGKMKPGDRFSEQQLANTMQVSRTPIKEAINQLANDGLVRVYPQRYSEVMVFSQEDVRHMGEMRVALEMMAVKLALYHGSMADFNKLAKLADACDEALQSGDVVRRIETDAQFHLALTKCTRNELLYKFQRELCLRIQLIQVNSTFTEEEDSQLVEYHRQLVKYLKERDLERIYTLIEEHFFQFYKLDQEYPHKFFHLFRI